MPPDPNQLDDLLAGRIEKLCVGGGAPAPPAQLVFPGSFNPLHQGHRRMADAAAKLTGRPLQFEISLETVDKPPLDRPAIVDRLAQFAPRDCIWLTRAATFEEKSRLFAGATFVAGIDTLARLVDARWYGHSVQRWEAAIANIVARECRFLVFGRVVRGRFRTLSDLTVPRSLLDLCRQVTEKEFREDISSTAIRRESETSD